MLTTGAAAPLAAAPVVVAWAGIGHRLAGHRVTGAMVRRAGRGACLVGCSHLGHALVLP
jgi:hypothetical protein